MFEGILYEIDGGTPEEIFNVNPAGVPGESFELLIVGKTPGVISGGSFEVIPERNPERILTESLKEIPRESAVELPQELLLKLRKDLILEGLVKISSYPQKVP